MSTSVSIGAVGDDGAMSNTNSAGPRADGPKRRSFTQEQKRSHLTAYEAAVETGDGGEYLRSKGLYYSQVAEWRKLRDVDMLCDTPGPPPGGATSIRRMTVEQAEIAHLKRELDKSERRLARTEVALEIMGKARELLDELSKGSPEDPLHDKR